MSGMHPDVGHLARLEKSVDEKLRLLAEAMVLIRADRRDEALAMITGAANSDTSTELDAASSDVDERLAEAINEGTRWHQRLNILMFGSIIWTIGGAVLIGSSLTSSAQRQVTALEETEVGLRSSNDRLERNAQERTLELATLNQKLASALTTSHTSVFSQTPELVYDWVYNPPAGMRLDDFMGKGDDHIFPDEEARALSAMKQAVLETGEPQTGNLQLTFGKEVHQFRIHITPSMRFGKMAGLISSAVDISSEVAINHNLEEISNTLETTLQRLNMALRGSHVTVYAQDKDLRYRWSSRQTSDPRDETIVGRIDEDVLPEPARDTIIAMKQRVLHTGEDAQSEVRMLVDGVAKWYDVRIGPSRSRTGDIDGVLAVSVDITERKQREQRIHLLLREVTHRSKNLLAIIQAMARRTAINATSEQDFVEKFSRRVQSLSHSHDLLVGSNWTGAPLQALAQSQLASFGDAIETQTEITGPHVWIKSEAAQNIGMALHELATNALKYGALSIPQGKVAITWAFDESGDLVLRWEEVGGPPIEPPRAWGFGRTVMERIVGQALNAKSVLELPPSGARWTVHLAPSWMGSDDESA